MDNNQMNFDPMTGQPINQNINNAVSSNQIQGNTVQSIPIVQPVPTVEQVQPIQTVTPIQPVSTVKTIPQQDLEPTTPVDNTTNMHQQMQSIPTVEQSKQDFINNTQTNSVVKKADKKENSNIAFIVILFIIIFAAIFFLFPYLMDILG